MRVSQEEKERSHARIVGGAARLVRQRGIGATSVADVMTDAGMTHGGFYRHFDTKDALVEAALAVAFDDVMRRLGAPGEGRTFLGDYLSDGHLAHPGLGCPVPALGSEIARGSARLKAAFGAGVRRVLGGMASGKADAAQAQAQAARAFATAVGAILIARASDPDTAALLLSACRDALTGEKTDAAMPRAD